MKSLCCNSEYHQHCLNQCRERGHTTCLYCRCTMQPLPQMNCPLRRLWGGRRNAGGGDGSGSNGGGRGRGGGGGEGGEVGAVEGVVVGGGVAGGGGGGGEGGELGGVVVGGGVAGGGGQEKGGEGRGHHGGRVDVNSLGEITTEEEVMVKEGVKSWKGMKVTLVVVLVEEVYHYLLFSSCFYFIVNRVCLLTHHQRMTEMKRKVLKEELMIKVEIRIQVTFFSFFFFTLNLQKITCTLLVVMTLSSWQFESVLLYC